MDRCRRICARPEASLTREGSHGSIDSPGRLTRRAPRFPKRRPAHSCGAAPVSHRLPRTNAQRRLPALNPMSTGFSRARFSRIDWSRSEHHEMKIARTVLLICALVASLAPPIFLLAVRHFHLEVQTSEWMVSQWPRSLGEIALEDRRMATDMVVIYGEWMAANTLTFTAIGWSVLFLFRMLKRSGARDRSLHSE